MWFQCSHHLQNPSWTTQNHPQLIQMLLQEYRMAKHNHGVLLHYSPWNSTPVHAKAILTSSIFAASPPARHLVCLCCPSVHCFHMHNSVNNYCVYTSRCGQQFLFYFSSCMCEEVISKLSHICIVLLELGSRFINHFVCQKIINKNGGASLFWWQPAYPIRVKIL